MEHCRECRAFVQGRGEFCPLCGTPLETGGGPRHPVAENLYPDMGRTVNRYNLVKRLSIFITVLGVGMSVLINLLVNPGFLWCLIVLAAAIYCWLAIPPLLRRGKNYAARTVLSVILTCALAVALDVIIGYRGWSVSYVVPGLLTAGTLAIDLMIIFNRTSWTQYVIYQLILGFFGFAPLVLFFVGLASNLVLVLVSTGVSFASLLAAIVLGDNSIKSEFKRRFHF